MPGLAAERATWVIAAVVAVVMTGLGFWVVGRLAPSPETTRPAADVNGVVESDPRMAAAVAEARRRWPEFAALFRRRQPGQQFFVKARFMEGHAGEWLWVSVGEIDRDTITGTVDTPPNRVKNLQVGGTVTVRRADVGDWLYQSLTESKGGFTTKALDAIEADRGGAGK